MLNKPTYFGIEMLSGNFSNFALQLQDRINYSTNTIALGWFF